MLPELEVHPHARAVLAGVVENAATASHAYLFHGPGGAGKRTAARALAAELLAEGSPDHAGARARALTGSHPDLTWVTPSGAHEILVSDIAAPVIMAASRTPFEATRRVFVIERADELGEEAANRMLKTLEEPPSYVHMILISDRPGDVLATIRSRCQAVRFDAPSARAVAEALSGEGLADDLARACAALALGDARVARELARGPGQALRGAAEGFSVAVCDGEASARPWRALLEAVRQRGEALREELELLRDAETERLPKKEHERKKADWDERIKRARRRHERLTLDLGLQLVSLWFADLASLAWRAEDLVRNVDRRDQLAGCAGADAGQLLRAIETVEETRSRFALNVSEELACEALAYRLEQVLDR